MAGMFEPCHFGLRVCGCQPLGRLDGNESVHAAEDEQLGYLQRVQHVVHVAAFDHASQ